MSIIRSHIEQILHEAIAQRTYTSDQMRKVVVAGSRFIQKANKHVNKFYVQALISYPELWSNKELIKRAALSPVRDGHYIVKTLDKLKYSVDYSESPTIQWYRETYRKCQFGGPLPREVLTKKKEEDNKKEDGLWIKTETLAQVDESIKKKKVKKESK